MPDAATRTGSRPSLARRSSCSASSRSPRASARCSCPAASAACRKRPASPRASPRWLAAHADMPGAAFLPQRHSVDGVDVRLPGRRLRARTGRLDHRRQLSGARSHARAQRAIVREYLQWAMCGEPRPAGTFDLYAVEGGTAAMCYLFKSLKANRLLNPGDTIALATPIFTPYLEMPHLEDYGLNMTVIPARQEQRWQFTDEDLKPLLDPKVKAFFVVNPGNPYAVALSREVDRERSAASSRRVPTCMLLTDDVYGTFVDRVPLAARRVSAGTRSASTPTASISAAPAGASASSRCTSTTSSTRRSPRIPTRSSAGARQALRAA